MTLGVMEGFIFLPQNFLKKVSNFALFRGYLMGDEIFFEFFFAKKREFCASKSAYSERTF